LSVLPSAICSTIHFWKNATILPLREFHEATCARLLLLLECDDVAFQIANEAPGIIANGFIDAGYGRRRDETRRRPAPAVMRRP
jgi:hypothetical protein